MENSNLRGEIISAFNSNTIIVIDDSVAMGEGSELFLTSISIEENLSKSRNMTLPCLFKTGKTVKDENGLFTSKREYKLVPLSEGKAAEEKLSAIYKEESDKFPFDESVMDLSKF